MWRADKVAEMSPFLGTSRQEPKRVWAIRSKENFYWDKIEELKRPANPFQNQLPFVS